MALKMASPYYQSQSFSTYVPESKTDKIRKSHIFHVGGGAERQVRGSGCLFNLFPIFMSSAVVLCEMTD